MAVSEDGGAQRIRDCCRWAGVDVGYARMTGRASMFICSMADSQKRNWLGVSGVAEKRKLEDDVGAHQYCGSGRNIRGYRPDQTRFADRRAQGNLDAE